jgi:hypothetical protein
LYLELGTKVENEMVVTSGMYFKIVVRSFSRLINERGIRYLISIVQAFVYLPSTSLRRRLFDQAPPLYLFTGIKIIESLNCAGIIWVNLYLSYSPCAIFVCSSSIGKDWYVMFGACKPRPYDNRVIEMGMIDRATL